MIQLIWPVKKKKSIKIMQLVIVIRVSLANGYGVSIYF